MPRSSIQGLRRYFLKLAQNKTPFWGAVSGVSLTKEKNKTGIVYSEAQFRRVSPLTPEQTAQFREYANMIRPALERMAVDAQTFQEDSKQ
jgi:hypothetical protein